MRSYGQFCGLAFGLDIIGDRWNLLIVRNLILGPQRWKEMRFNLPGIAKNLLSKRLKDLEEASVIFSENETYALTQKGRELEPIVFAIASWGEEHFVSDGEEYQKRKRFFYTSLRRKIKASQKEATGLLRVDDDILVVSLGPEPTLVQWTTDVICDAVFTTDFLTLVSMVFDGEKWRRAEEDGYVSVTGSRRVADQLMKSLRF